MAYARYIDKSKEGLITRIAELEKRKKYGLVWEYDPETIVTQCKEKSPVLREVATKAVSTDKSKPVNLLIEGDNYHALSVLNYTHKEKIDVIYIAPLQYWCFGLEVQSQIRQQRGRLSTQQVAVRDVLMRRASHF